MELGAITWPNSADLDPLRMYERTSEAKTRRGASRSSVVLQDFAYSGEGSLRALAATAKEDQFVGRSIGA
jgi:hypothetical protein